MENRFSTIYCHDLWHGNRVGYNGLKGVTGGYRGYKGLQGVTGGLQVVTSGDRVWQRVKGGYKGL